METYCNTPGNLSSFYFFFIRKFLFVLTKKTTAERVRENFVRIREKRTKLKICNFLVHCIKLDVIIEKFLDTEQLVFSSSQKWQ